MAIVFQNNKYDITIHSKTIIGVMGNNYKRFLKSLTGDNIFYLDNQFSISNKKVGYFLNIDNSNTINLIKEFNYKDDYVDKKINELSHSEQKILKYILMVQSDKKIIVIDEPFMDLDYINKKKVILLLNKLVKEDKTIIIGSLDSNNLYSVCKKILLINNNEYYYGDINDFNNRKLLSKYHVNMPDLVKFVVLAKNKNINLKYSQDIRDLIKDVYRNVS